MHQAPLRAGMAVARGAGPLPKSVAALRRATPRTSAAPRLASPHPALPRPAAPCRDRRARRHCRARRAGPPDRRPWPAPEHPLRIGYG